MMTTPVTGSDHESQLDELLASYWRDAASDSAVDRQRLFDRHPHVATELGEYFADQDRFEAWAKPLRVICQAATAAGALVHLHESLVGQSVGDFELLAEIGRGGMGVVYKARQKSLGRFVAVKMMLTSPLASERESQRFRHEAEAAAHLDHPRIVPIYEIGAHEGRPLFSMKLFEGGSLAERLDHYQANPRHVVDLVIAVARAVHHAHQRGLLHRDLKPSNILLDADGQPHVADFGLAKWQVDQGQTQSGMIVGTPAYMAPEQAATSCEPDVDGHGGARIESDVYSLGAVLYTMLTGKPPFHGTTPLDILLAVREQLPVDPAVRNPLVDRDLNTICLKCLEKEPGRRYHTAEALADDLERWCAKLPIAAREIRGGERVWRWCRRNPLVAALVGIAALLVIVVFVGLSAGIGLLKREHDEALRHQSHSQKQEAVAIEKARELRSHLYAAQMNQAWHALQIGDMWQVRTLIEKQWPDSPEQDLRGFEWRYLNETCLLPRMEKAILTCHTGAAFSVAFSPDGTLMATAGEDRTAGIWDVASRQRLFTLPGQDDDQNSVAFHPSGKILVTASEDGYIWTWDVATGRQRQLRTRLPVPIPQVAFSRDGRWLAAAAWDGHVRIYSFPEADQSAFDEPRVLRNAHEPKAECVSFSPDGKMLATGGRDSTVKLWDTATGECLHVLPRYRDTGVIKSVAFAYGQPLLAAGSYGGRIGVWNTTTGQLLHELTGNLGDVQAIAFSPDDETLASCHGLGSVQLWDVAMGTPQATFVGHGTRTWALAYSPDGKILASADQKGRILFWNTAPPPLRRPIFQGQGNLNECLFLPDGKTVAVAGDEIAIRLFDAATGQLRNTFPQPGLISDRLGYSPDGATLVASYNDGTVRLWEIDGGRCRLTIQAHRGWMQAVRLTPDCGKLLTLSYPDGMLVWDAATGASLGSITLEQSKTIAVATAGQMMATWHVDGHVALWDMTDLSAPRHILPAQFRGVECLAISRDNGRLAIQSGDTIELWDVDATAPRHVFIGSLNAASSLAFSPDGQTLASVNRTGALKLWHIASGQEVMTVHPNDIRHVCFSPDGRMLIASSGSLLFALDAPRSDEKFVHSR